MTRRCGTITASSHNNTALGRGSPGRSLTCGAVDVVIGSSTADNLVTGGCEHRHRRQLAGLGLATGSNNIILGSNLVGPTTAGDFNIWLGATGGAERESSTIRIGNGAHTRAFVAGISGQTSPSRWRCW